MSSQAPSLSTLGFQALSSIVYYSPKDAPAGDLSALKTASTAFKEPDGIEYDLIMIWGWMDASPRHLVKYIQLHRLLQPGVPIIFIQSTAATWIGLTSELRTSLPLVYNVVRSLSEEPKIFVHTFSNGGTGAFGKFLALYRHELGCPMPIAAMLIDSAPGGTKYPDAVIRGVYAFTAQVRNAILQNILNPILFVIISLAYGIPALLGIENPISIMRRTLNDETLVPGGASRGYTYCKGDIMVDWKEIEEHANEAVERGWPVMKKGFEGGSHVGGYRHHPKEYEDFVRELRRGDKSSTK